MVTGIGGFLGRHLLRTLVQAGYSVRGIARSPVSMSADEQADVGSAEVKIATADLNSLASADSMPGDFQNTGPVDIFYHLAGRAHRPSELADEQYCREFEADNVSATIAAYHLARRWEAKRFVHLSSIKVLGDVSTVPFRPDLPYAPEDVYARTKCAAEQGLIELEREHRLPVTIIRPPLIFGAGVKGNMKSLIDLVGSGWPLPLGSAHAKRSFVGATNLCDLLVNYVPKDQAALRVLHVREREDLSVRELLIAISGGMGKSARLFPLPEKLLRTTLKLVGRTGLASRLLSPMQVDDSPTRELFDWTPPYTIGESIEEMLKCPSSRH